MDFEKAKKAVIVASIFHDIGKFWQRAVRGNEGLSHSTLALESELCPEFGKYRHVLWTSEFFESFEKFFPIDVSEKLTDEALDNVKNLSARHHKPSTPLHYIIQQADWLSSGMDRVKTADAQDEEIGAFREKKLISIFSYDMSGNGKNWVYNLTTLKPTDDVFPFEEKERVDLTGEYARLWVQFIEDFKNASVLGKHFNIWVGSILSILERYTWCIPSSTKDVPDVSLYDHLKTTSAIALALFYYHHATHSLNSIDNIKDKKRKIFYLLLIPFLIALSQEKPTVIKCGALIDGKSDEVKKNVLILISGNKIEKVGNFKIPENADVIDLSDMTVLPGLIDAHVHFFLHEGNYDDQLLKESIPYRTIRAVVHAKQTLEAGFTTVRDLETEGAGYADVDLKKAIDQGIIPGPRMQVSTRALSVTGGYALMGYSWEIQVPTGAQLVDGVDEARKAVREQIKYGADWIKIYADSRRRRSEVADSLTWYLTFSDDELKAIVEEANKMNVKVAAHCYSSIAAQKAVNSGVASIEHGLYLDEPTLKLMKEKGVYYCPTLLAYYRWSKREGLSPEVKKMIENTVKLHAETFKRALKVGVKIAFGSDLTEAHGSNAEEFELMVKYGMKPMDAIKSATSVAAELLGWQDKIGSIEPGKLADIIAVKGDPLKDISVLKDVKFVMKDGKIVKNSKQF